MNFLRVLFIITGIIGILLFLTADNAHGGHLNMMLTGIGLIISSLLMIIALYNIDLHLEKNKDKYKKYNKYRQRLVFSVLLIIAGGSDVIWALIDITSDHPQKADGYIGFSGGVAIMLGVIMFLSIQD